MDSLIDFAKVKLLGGSTKWADCNKGATTLAIMSSRFALRVSPQVCNEQI